MRDISDTALWTAVFRARESEREDALFRDPYAKRLAGERGEQITDSLKHAGEHPWAWVIRTYLFDRIITERVKAGADLVIDLATGLDARAYRMPLPADLRWIEVDLPHLISYKEEILANEKPCCALERVGLDLSDAAQRRELFRRVAYRSRRVLVLSEALLIYLTPEENGALAQDLAAQPNFAWWLFDLASPALLEYLRRTSGQHTDRAGAPLRFGPSDGPEFFRNYGWQPEEIRSVFQAAIETHRVPKELESFAAIAEPPEPWTLPIPWLGVCLMRKTRQNGGWPA